MFSLCYCFMSFKKKLFRFILTSNCHAKIQKKKLNKTIKRSITIVVFVIILFMLWCATYYKKLMSHKSSASIKWKNYATLSLKSNFVQSKIT